MDDYSYQERDARRYRLLRDYLLFHGFIRHVEMPEGDGGPFVTGVTFYGPTFGDAVDALGSIADVTI